MTLSKKSNIMGKTTTLKKPSGTSNKWALRDVVPIILNSKLTDKQVYKFAESGIDLKENC